MFRPLKDKSPLHPSALRIRDVHPGRRFITFNLGLGIIKRGEFISEPFPAQGFLGRKSLKVRIREPHGMVHDAYLEDMGIISYGILWNDRNFSIDARKQRLLPEPNIKKFPPGGLDEDDDY